MRFSAAMTGEAEAKLASHLLREDGQEDLTFLTWRPSSGQTRTTAILGAPILPRAGERHIHGNASFEPEYMLRAAQEAGRTGRGLAFVHSHPVGQGWQSLNATDRTAEARVANVARELTGLPLVGLTVAGDHQWSGRVWRGVGRELKPTACESVRVIGEGLSVTFNDALVPVPYVPPSQDRTVHAWGDKTQAMIARLRVAVAGVGSVGMLVAETLARTGVHEIGVFDFDTVESVNLDRLRGARPLDAILMRSKVDVARRLLGEASTAVCPQHQLHELSICEAEGLSRLLDYDLIFSCVDRPWPRHVLNTIAYADLIPVIEGGLRAFRSPVGTFRNAYWSSTVVRPGRPCLVCLQQYDPGLVQLERDGSLDDPSYIAGLPVGASVRSRENVAALSVCVTSALLRQFISLVARPSGFGDLGPLRFEAREYHVESQRTGCLEACPYQADLACGDARIDPTGHHSAAERAREMRASVPLWVKVGRNLDAGLDVIRSRLAAQLRPRK